VSFATATEAKKAYGAGRRDVMTTDVTGLYAARLTLAASDDHVILPEVISKEPLGPAVWHGDNQWADIVRWTFNTMLDAEELGVTEANVSR
jgi:general L-amino acid transport system substrate-binding protein